MNDKPAVTLHSRQFLHGLSGIVNDLWGTPAPPADAKDASSAPVQAAFPSFEQIWRIADETIDWTEALAHDKPADGLTTPETWALYHRYAAAVLSGDVSAYIDVLRTLNPLGDLAAYAASFEVVAESADLLQVRFEALPAFMQGVPEENRRYLAGMSLRVARDLFALLPVMQVSVQAMHEDRALLSVSFEKAELMKVRFAFIDPADFVEGCGGIFSL